MSRVRVCCSPLAATSILLSIAALFISAVASTHAAIRAQEEAVRWEQLYRSEVERTENRRAAAACGDHSNCALHKCNSAVEGHESVIDFDAIEKEVAP